MTKSTHNLNLTSGFTALFTVLFTFGAFFTGYGLRQIFPTFDGFPLFFILLGALTVACVANRLSAKVYARNHFGMPPAERHMLIERHLEECRQDPKAVLARYNDIESIPVFMLILYFILTFVIGATSMLCMDQDFNFERVLISVAGTIISGHLMFKASQSCLNFSV